MAPTYGWFYWGVFKSGFSESGGWFSAMSEQERKLQKTVKSGGGLFLHGGGVVGVRSYSIGESWYTGSHLSGLEHMSVYFSLGGVVCVRPITDVLMWDSSAWGYVAAEISVENREFFKKKTGKNLESKFSPVMPLGHVTAFWTSLDMIERGESPDPGVLARSKFYVFGLESLTFSIRDHLTCSPAEWAERVWCAAPVRRSWKEEGQGYLLARLPKPYAAAYLLYRKKMMGKSD